MTREQYLRAADILGEKLGLQNHPRVVVLHDDGEQPHLHIVWQRADVETMTMWADGNNYRKHEQPACKWNRNSGRPSFRENTPKREPRAAAGIPPPPKAPRTNRSRRSAPT